MSTSERIRKIHICLRLGSNLYSFCWMTLLTNGSLSFGFTSKTLKLVEYGTSVVRSGVFNEHAQILTRGTVNIKNADTPHITFHPPRIEQKSGVAHVIASNGKVDEWELDWFPVKKPQLLLAAYTGDITMLDTVIKPKEQYEIVNVPLNLRCLRMELILYPRQPTSKIRLDDPNAKAHIMAICPNYFVSCNFYENPVVELGFYVATDRYMK